MSALRSVVGMLADAVSPDPTVIRNRMRVTVDLLLTLGITLVAIALAVGYQLFARWGHLIFGDDE